MSTEFVSGIFGLNGVIIGSSIPIIYQVVQDKRKEKKENRGINKRKGDRHSFLIVAQKWGKMTRLWAFLYHYCLFSSNLCVFNPSIQVDTLDV